MMRKVVIWSSLALIALTLIRELEYAGLRRSRSGEYHKLTTVFLDSSKYDLLILGSSRAEGQLYSPTISSSTGLKTYNAGMTGAVMPLIVTTFKAWLVHHPAPKVVILHLDLHSINDSPDTVFNFPRYFAYLENPELYHGLNEMDPRFFYFRWMPLYSMPYFSDKYLANSLRGWMNRPGAYDEGYEEGFAPSLPAADFRVIPYKTSTPLHMEAGIREIDRICDSLGTSLFALYSPLYHEQSEWVENYTNLKSYYSEICSDRHIKVLDMSDDSVSNYRYLYADPAHLNRSGALQFTGRFCDSLQQYLNN